MSQKALCIMAAGLGTRFGGLKQLHPIANDFAIIDFSIYDAHKAGFNEIILIIRQENQLLFDKHFANIDSSIVKITYVYQSLDLPIKFNKDSYRKKPWGTGHALLMLDPVITNNFALINADDFYGREAFKIMYDNLYTTSNTANYLIGYEIENTLSLNGSVSRGECVIGFNSKLKHIYERQNVRLESNQIVYDEGSSLSQNTIVSMNFWGFTHEIFEIGKKALRQFIKKTENLETDEFYITKIVDLAIRKNHVFKVLHCQSKWYGITYKEDKKDMKQHLTHLIESKHYPKYLCNKTS